MSELLSGQLVKWASGVLLSLLAGTATCASSGCVKIKSIGLAADPPVVEVEAFGAKITVRAVSVEFYPDEAETVEP